MLYKLFIDDSGSKDFINPFDYRTKESLYPWNDGNKKWLNDNFFTLCGVYVNIDDLATIDEELKKLKYEVFGTVHVEIKSAYLRSPKLRERFYLKKYPGVTEQDLKRLGDSIHDIIKNNKGKLTILASVFDKRHYKNRNPINYPDNQPLMKCSQVLFERIEKIGNDTHIVFDQMEASLSVLKGKHKGICDIANGNTGLENWYIDDYKHIKNIEFQQSCNENLLQIADICAYNIRRQFMEHGKTWLEGGTHECGSYNYFDMIRCNLHHSKGNVIGFGLSIIPNFKKIQWQLRDGCEEK